MKNIMYLLGIEKGDNVDVYHDSEDSRGGIMQQYL